MNGLSLCAGIGGLDLGFHLAVPEYRTICYVEIEAYPQNVLLARMADGVLDRAPIWGDIKQFDGRPWRGLVDVLHGGYPCQPFSVAGKRSGTDDPRHLWPDIARIIAECDPEWCFFENVAGHLTLGFNVVARSLEEMDYWVAAGLFTAAEVGAPHRRQRLYILARRRQGDGMADTGCGGEHAGESRRGRGSSGEAEAMFGSSGATVGHVELARWSEARVGLSQHTRAELESGCGNMGWPPGPQQNWRSFPDNLKPAICRVANGVPHRVDRLKALGNGVVPQVAALAWRTLMGSHA